MIAVAREPHPERVVIIDDTEDLRFLLRAALIRAGIDVVGEAGDGLAGIETVRETDPDVVLLDLAMPVLDGREALPRLRKVAPGARIIVFSGFGADLLSDELLELGAHGYIEKGHPLSRIVQYVEDAAAAPAVIGSPGPVLRLIRD